MHSKILIVDAIATNRIVLKVKLAGAFYEVFQAGSIEEATRIAAKSPPDLAICGCNLRDGDAASLVQALATSGAQDVPVMAVAPGLRGELRRTLLASGVDDVVDDIHHDALLLARVRSLIRAHTSATEWQIRDDTTRALGFAEDRATFKHDPVVTLVANDAVTAQNAARALRPAFAARISTATPNTALNIVPRDNAATMAVPDIFVLVADGAHAAVMLALISSIRCHSDTRHSGILVLHPEDAYHTAAQALDLGADTVMTRDLDARELALRLSRLMQRKTIGDQLRATVRTGLEAAVSDPLTGLHNRRYAMPHLARLIERATASGRPFALMVADLDHFKQVNDVYGHAAGDAVLVEAARRLRENLRGVDLVARVGGEEFLIVMPAIELADARIAAKRLCDLIGDTPFAVPGIVPGLNVTISIGLVLGGVPQDQPGAGVTPDDQAHALMARADKALYAAKMRGRNCVKLSRPAA